MNPLEKSISYALGKISKSPVCGHKLSGRVKLQVIDDAGAVLTEGPWVKNLLLNLGMDNIATVFYADIFLHACVGTAILATVLDSAGTTAAQALGTVTANNPIFVAGDVGNVIHWTGGEEATITAFVSTTVVTVANSATVGAAVFKIYRTNQTALSAEVKRETQYSQKAADNTTTDHTATQAYRRMRRSFIFAAETATTTYKEIGFSDQSAAGANLNIRIDLNGASANMVVPITRRLKAIYELQVNLEPDTVQVSASSLISGIDTSADTGHFVLEALNLSSINSSGDSVTTTADLEPAADCVMAFSSNAAAVVAFSGATRRTNVTVVPLTKAAYNTGDYTLSLSGTFDLADTNRTDLRSLMLYDQSGERGAFTFLFDNPVTKDPDHTMTVNWTKTWARTLS